MLQIWKVAEQLDCTIKMLTIEQEKDFTVVNQHGLVGTQKWTNKLKVGDTRWNDQAVLAASKSEQNALNKHITPHTDK